MARLVTQKPVYPYLPNVCVGISELSGNRVPEGMKCNFCWQAKAGLELGEDPAQCGPSVFLFRPIKAGYEVIAFGVVLEGHYAGLYEFGV